MIACIEYLMQSVDYYNSLIYKKLWTVFGPRSDVVIQLSKNSGQRKEKNKTKHVMTEHGFTFISYGIHIYVFVDIKSLVPVLPPSPSI